MNRVLKHRKGENKTQTHSWKFLIVLSLVLLMVCGYARPGSSLTSTFGQENISVSITVEFKSSGRCSIRAEYGGMNPIYYSYLTGEQVAENVPIQKIVNVGWDLNLSVEQLDNQTAKITATGWLIGPFDEQQKSQISLAVAAYKLSSNSINQQVKQLLQTKLQNYGIETTDVTINSLNWDSGSSKFSFSLGVAFRSSKLVELLSSELPIELTSQGSGSGPQNIKSAEDAVKVSLDALLKATANTWAVDFQAGINGTETSGSLNVEFELLDDPYGFVTREENTVSVNFGKLREILPSELKRPGDLPQFTLTLIVPPGSRVENLPAEYNQNGNVYVWNGSDGIDALTDLVNGYSETRLEYWVGPAVVEIENVASLIGKTVTTENATSENVIAENGLVTATYVSNIQIENEQSITVNFDEGQPVRKVRMRFAQKAQAVRLRLKQLAERPATVSEVPSEKGLVAYYLELAPKETPEIKSGTIEFKVPLAWINANNIDRSAVKLLRYSDGSWQELSTSKLSEDSAYAYYSAKTPGFSVFAVSGATLPTQPFFTLPPLVIVALAAIILVAVIAGIVWRYTSREIK